MNYKMYSIKDTVVGQFGQIFLFNNDLVAKRYFFDIAKDSKIKGDLQLFRVGEFNIETGEVVAEVEFLASGVDENA